MAITKGWQVHPIHSPEYGGYELVVLNSTSERAVSLVHPLTLTEVPLYGQVPPGERSIVRPEQAEELLQAMMDAAWQIGLRPTGVADPTNELTAVRYHLEDMRQLANIPGSGEAFKVASGDREG